jgi:hypothetical protein
MPVWIIIVDCVVVVLVVVAWVVGVVVLAAAEVVVVVELALLPQDAKTIEITSKTAVNPQIRLFFIIALFDPPFTYLVLYSPVNFLAEDLRIPCF